MKTPRSRTLLVLGLVLSLSSRAGGAVFNCGAGDMTCLIAAINAANGNLVLQCAVGAKNHGQFVSCVSHVTNNLKKQGVLSGDQENAIQDCAAGAPIP